MSAPVEKLPRIQIELAEDRLREIEELMQRGGLTTKKDLFNNAISILEWAIETVEDGNVVAALNRSEKQYEVLRMPVLDAASKKSQPRRASEGGHLAPRFKLAT